MIRRLPFDRWSSTFCSSFDDWLRTGMTIEFLGTSSARPTKTRNVSSLILHHSKGSYMFDCGDGTLRQLLCSQVARAHRIEAVFLTHLHCDHFYGLPAVALAISGAQEDDSGTLSAPTKKTVYSPRGLRRLLGPILERNMNIIEFGTENFGAKHRDSSLPFNEHVVFETEDLLIAAVFIKHSIACAGYIIREKPTFKIDAQKMIEKYNLHPSHLYGQLQKHNVVESPIDGTKIYPKDVLIQVPSRTIVVLGDTFDPSAVIPYATDCDLLVHESTGVEFDRHHILQNCHSTGRMAGEFARKVRAKHLILNHFSPRQVIAGVPCDEATYQRQILKEAKEAAGQEVLVTASYDHLAIPIPRRITKAANVPQHSTLDHH